jgi:microcystin degradation protein MlrC
VRFARPAVVAIAAVLGFGACTSQPSAKAVAQDYVESIGLEPDEQSCMLGKLDNYTSDELEAIGDANLTVDWDQPSAAAVASGTPELQKLVDDLGTCMAGSS